MRKQLSLIVTSILLCTTACGNNDLSSNSINNNETVISELSSYNDIQPITESSCDISVYFNSSEKIENYICRKNFYEVNNWVYYCSDKNLRKCRLDLTEDTLVMENVYSFYIQNMTLYYEKYSENNNREFFRAYLNNDKFDEERIAEFSREIYNPIFFRDSVFYECSNKIIMYTLNNDNEKTIVNDNVSSFSIVDHYVYYNIYDNNTICRYDINEGKKEIFLNFEKQDIFTPKVYFINRMIIIQTDINSFTYANIEDTSLKNISFDISGYERGWASLCFVDKENLYFSIAEHYDVSNPLTTPRSIFEVKVETSEIEFIKIITGDNLRSLINNNIYSFDNNNKIYKEELYG